MGAAFSRDQVRAGIDALRTTGYGHAAAAIGQLLNSHDQRTEAATVLATALDNLGARIHRDLHTESSYTSTDDKQLADLLDKFSAYSDECLGALDHPAVRALLDGGA
jgi:metal-dependent HD superfamily phosphatase/phosphodiesterase